MSAFKRVRLLTIKKWFLANSTTLLSHFFAFEVSVLILNLETEQACIAMKRFIFKLAALAHFTMITIFFFADAA